MDNTSNHSRYKDKPLSLIKDFYEFTKENELSCAEQALYLRLFMIANAEFWPESIKVSSMRLIQELKISRPVFFKTRKRLIDLGLISVKSTTGGGQEKTEYILQEIGLLGGSNIDQSKIELVKNRTTNRSKIEPPTSQKENYHTPREANNDGASETAEDYKTIRHNNTRDIESNIISARARESDDGKSKKSNSTGQDDETKKAADFIRVREEYENNIHPVTGIYEAEKLIDDIEHYGAETVIKAIRRAVLRNARSLGYIEGILRRWQADGYDGEEGKHEPVQGVPGNISPETREYIELNKDKLEAWWSGKNGP